MDQVTTNCSACGKPFGDEAVPPSQLDRLMSGFISDSAHKTLERVRTDGYTPGRWLHPGDPVGNIIAWLWKADPIACVHRWQAFMAQLTRWNPAHRTDITHDDVLGGLGMAVSGVIDNRDEIHELQDFLRNNATDF